MINKKIKISVLVSLFLLNFYFIFALKNIAFASEISLAYIDEGDLYNTALPIDKSKKIQYIETYQESSQDNYQPIKKVKKPKKTFKKIVNKTTKIIPNNSAEIVKTNTDIANKVLTEAVETSSKSQNKSSAVVKPKKKRKISLNKNNLNFVEPNKTEESQNYKKYTKEIIYLEESEDDGYKESEKNKRFERPSFSKKYPDNNQNNSYTPLYYSQEFRQKNHVYKKINDDLNDSENSPIYIDKADLYNTALPIGYQQNQPRIETTKTIPKPQNIVETPKKPAISKNLLKVSDKQISKIEDNFFESQKIKKFIKSDSKTVGNYLGIDFINTALRYEQIDIMPADYEDLNYFNGIPRDRNERSYKSKNGISFKYLYAINFNGIFLAPEIFYNHINLKHNSDLNHLENNDMALTKYFGYRYNKIHNQYGVKLNLGYDLNSDFALYGFFGLSKIKYSNLYSLYPYYEAQYLSRQFNIDFNKAISVYRGTATTPVYGFGTKIKLSKRFYLNGEYMISDFYSKTNSNKIKSYEAYGCQIGEKQICNNNRSDFIKLHNMMRIFKIGLTYNF
jgi:hypothetical protein